MRKALILTTTCAFVLAAPILGHAYTINSGDTLSEIAAEYDMSINEILELNPDIKNKDIIIAGEKLNLAHDEIEQKEIDVAQDEFNAQTSQISADEHELLARTIHAEAKGESYEGKVAVGHVILNRVDDDSFPDTIEEVIYQSGQFQPVMDGSIYEAADSASIQAATEAIETRGNNQGSLYFYNPEIATDSWIFSTDTVKVIDNHVFSR